MKNIATSAFLASANLGLAAPATWITNSEPILRVFLMIFQLAVAAVTVVFVYKSIKKLDAKDK